MNRRDFSRALAGAAAASFIPAAFIRVAEAANAPAPPKVGASAEATVLYRRALVLDANASPLLEPKLPFSAATLDMARNCGVSVVKTTLGGFNGDFVSTVNDIAFLQQVTEVHPDYFMQVRTPSDMERAKRDNKLGIIFSFEAVTMLEGRLDRIELFRNLGVRVMQLSHNDKSPFASGVVSRDGGGLSALGRDAVKQMNDLGIAIDLSDSNAASTADVMALSSQPVLMTHAGCAGVHPHPSNKTDEQLRALAAKGGVIGIYALPYLTASPKQPGIDDYIAHIEYALKVAGEDHVGIGSGGSIAPFDTSPKGMADYKKLMDSRQRAGVAAPEEDRPPFVNGLNNPRRLEAVTEQLLKRGYPARAAEKILGGNFDRVLTEIWS